MTAGEIILVIIYTAALYGFILRLPFFRQFSLPVHGIALLFLLKVLTGIAYGLLHAHLYSGGDTFSYFNESKILLSALPDHPGHFFRLTFWYTIKPPPADLASYESQMIYWNIVNSYFMVRLNTVMNLVSFTHYYVNVVIYNFLTLIGILFLYRWLFEQVIHNKGQLVFLMFFFPSVAFWSSRMHKDGIALAALGLILYNFQKLLGERKWLNIFLFLFGTWLLLMVRNYLLLLLLPCLVAYFLSHKYLKYMLVLSLLVLMGFYLALFNMHRVFPAFNLARSMSQQQSEFAAISSAVTLPMHRLSENNPSSLLAAMPLALTNCLLHPQIFKPGSLYHLPFAMDNVLALLLMILILFAYRKTSHAAPIIFCLLFAVSVFLFTGSVVPNLGALLRYKMPAMLFLMAALFSMTDFSKIKRKFTWD